MPYVKVVYYVLQSCPHVLCNGAIPVRYESCHTNPICNKVIHT